MIIPNTLRMSLTTIVGGAVMFPGVVVGLGGSLAASAYLGYAAGQGMPVPNDAQYLLGMPFASSAVSTLSPFMFGLPDNDGPIIKPLAKIGLIGGAALETVGYVGGYVAGRWHS